MTEQQTSEKYRTTPQLWQAGRTLSAAEVESLELQLQTDQSTLDIRVQLLAFYSEPQRDRKIKDLEEKLPKQVLWFIENKPSMTGFLALRLARTSLCFKPKTFAALREAWLEQVSSAPTEGTILGNAASFMAWIDIETALSLFERAYELQPTSGWLQTFIVHYNTELWTSPSLYGDKIRERIIDIGIRSLKTEHEGAPFLVCEYVSNAALNLGRFEIVRWCSEILRKYNEQMADCYLGLVALREHNRGQALRLMLKKKRGYGPQRIIFALARELFDTGERQAITQLISNFKHQIRAPIRNRWLQQIANDEAPDFESFHC